MIPRRVMLSALAGGASVCVLLALLPTAAAAAGDGVCDETDLHGPFRFTLGHPNGSLDSDQPLSALGQGDSILGDANANLDCEGAPITLVTYTRLNGELRVWSFDESVGFRVRPGVDFVNYEFFADAPACEFRAEIVLGTLSDGVVLESTEGGSTPCATLRVPACPTGVLAFTQGDAINLIWNEDTFTSSVRIERATAGGEFATIATLPRNSAPFSDTTVEAGVTYRYRVTAFNLNGEAAGCEVVQATAVPFFGSALVGALALVGAVGAYRFARQRP